MFLSTAIQQVRKHKRAHIIANVALYGLLFVAMAAAMIFPELHTDLVEAVKERAAASSDGFGSAVDGAYADENLPLAALFTFLFNLAAGSFLATIPSLAVPFVGILTILYRFALWGVLFAPVDRNWGSFFVHGLTVAAEGEAYALACLAIWIHGRMWLQPAKFDLSSRKEGYTTGLKVTARIYPLIIAILAVAAIYEACEVIYLLPKFG